MIASLPRGPHGLLVCGLCAMAALATAFLLAVQSAGPTGGAGRNPTWSDLAPARERLHDGRADDEARELQCRRRRARARRVASTRGR